jgi:ABC-type uncharacterized transport system involved in gliding motility auxiliary subunit
MGSRATVLGAIVLLVAAFFALNMAAGRGVRGLRLDVTQGRMYTLTAGSRNIARSPEEPITLTFYFSATLAQGQADVQSYGQRVREMLEEFARLSGGRIVLRVVDPEPFSEQEDAAVAAGLTGVPMNAAGDQLFLGLVGTNSTDGKETIPFFDWNKERFLEYDIAKLIYTLANPTRRVVGLISGLPLEGGFTMDPRTRQPQQTPPWLIMNELRNVVEVRTLSDPEEVPADVQVLMVVHPKSISDRALFAIDQYLLRGGRAVIFVDPVCDADQAGGGMFTPPEEKASNLARLFDAWGIEVPAGTIAADDRLAEQVIVRTGNRPEQVPYVAWLGCDRRSLSSEDAVTGNLSKVLFATSGFVRVKEGAPGAALVTPLVLTTDSAMAMPASALGMPPDPKAALRAYAPGKTALTLAGRVTGRVKSAFPDGRPVGQGDAAPATPPAPALAEGDLHAIVVADCDMLSDAMWARQQNFFGQTMLMKLSDNADLVLSAIDNLSGSSDLISVRARRESSRPFVVVQDMQRRATARSLAERQLLEEKQKQAEARIAELQGKRGTEQSSFVLTPEQEAEVAKFQAELLDTRKKLRAIRLEQRKDIDRLGVQLKLINTALVPALVALSAVGLGLYRRARRAESAARAAEERRS